MKAKGRQTDQAEEEVANTIYEFLQWANLEETLISFVAECKKRKVRIRQLKDPTSSGHSELKEDLMTAFEEGDSDGFFRLWPQAIGAEKDKQTQVLEFYLQVFFATVPLRDSNTSKASLSKAMTTLKTYLENGDGTKLSQIPELVPYFALPYVANPKQHPLFKDLTQEKWVKIIHQKLEKFLRSKLGSPETHSNNNERTEQKPKLLRMIRDSSEEKSSSESRDKMAQLQRKLHAAEKTNQKYKEMYGQLQKDYHRQITISAELVDALEQTVKGSPISTGYLEDLSARLVESNKAAQTHDAQSKLVPGQEPTSAVSTQPPSMQTTLEDDMGSFRAQVLSLNYPKIRNQVCQFPAQRETVHLLQAVRWRLTQAPKEVREPQLTGFCAGDILAIRSGAKSGKNVAISVFNCDSKQSKESLSRLINTLSSTKSGRAYVGSVLDGRDILQSIITALKLRKLEDFAQEHALAALQKLSLSVGKQAAARNPETIVKLMINLLQHKNEEIHPYINGILYSTLGIQKIRRKAQDMGMEAVIEAVLETSRNSNDSKQLPFVLKQLRGELTNQENEDSDEEGSPEDDEDEEEDYLESELDSNDTICGKPGDLIGEALLRARYVPSQTSIPRREERPEKETTKPKPRPLPPRPSPNEAKQPIQSEPPGTVPRVHDGLAVPKRTGTASTFTVADARRRPEIKPRPSREPRSLSPRKPPPLPPNQDKPLTNTSVPSVTNNQHSSQPLRTEKVSPTRGSKQTTHPSQGNPGKSGQKDRGRTESPPNSKNVSGNNKAEESKETSSNRGSRSESPRTKANRPTKPDRTESQTKSTKNDSSSKASPAPKMPKNESPRRKPLSKADSKDSKEVDAQKAKERIAASRKQRLGSQSDAKHSSEKSPEASLKSENDNPNPTVSNKKPSGIPRSKENNPAEQNRKRSQSQSQSQSRDRGPGREEREQSEVQLKPRGRSNSSEQILSPERNGLREEDGLGPNALRAPSIGKMNTRIPDEANVLEYAQIFGARPKLIRTPDAEALKKRNNAITMFF